MILIANTIVVLLSPIWVLPMALFWMWEDGFEAFRTEFFLSEKRREEFEK